MTRESQSHRTLYGYANEPELEDERATATRMSDAEACDKLLNLLLKHHPKHERPVKTLSPDDEQ